MVSTLNRRHCVPPPCCIISLAPCTIEDDSLKEGSSVTGRIRLTQRGDILTELETLLDHQGPNTPAHKSGQRTEA